MTRQLPELKDPVVSVGANLPDGILIRSHSYRSLKQEVAMISIYNPITIGLLAGMAIPAFQKVRASSQEKAITNNLRQLATAADQYYLEHGVDTATYDQLVGPEKYVRTFLPVMGEDYTHLKFKLGQPLRVITPDGRTIAYGDDTDASVNTAGNPAAAGIRGQVQALRASALPLFQGNMPHANFNAALARLESAASTINGNPTPAQSRTLNTALVMAIQLANGISQRPSETPAAKAKAAELEATLKTLQERIAGGLPAQ